VSGPYGVALGPRCYTGVTRSTDRGYPIINHIRELVDGPIVWAPAADGAVVLSQRGGDFELTVGQDFPSVIWITRARRCCSNPRSFTFRVLSPEAAVPFDVLEGSQGLSRTGSSRRCPVTGSSSFARTLRHAPKVRATRFFVPIHRAWPRFSARNDGHVRFGMQFAHSRASTVGSRRAMDTCCFLPLPVITPGSSRSR